ncbi:MAG: hypothetical protein R2911_12580 [Caldilineaceae bacterium]
MQPQPFQHGPHVANALAQFRLGIRRWVPGGDGHAVAQKVRSPAAADDAGSDD